MKFLITILLIVGMLYPVYYFMCLKSYLDNKWKYDKLYKREMNVKLIFFSPFVFYLCFLYAKLIIEMFGGK